MIISGCGQTGDLYLPKEQSEKTDQENVRKL